MTAITVCPECGKKYRTGRFKSGTKLRCKACGSVFGMTEQAAPGAVAGAEEPTPAAETPSDDDIDAEAMAAEMGGKSALRRAGMRGGGVTLSGGSDVLHDAATQIDPQETQDARAPGGHGAGVSPARHEQGNSVGELLSGAGGDGKYVTDCEIARGGMGAILRTIDRDIRREVAMKVILGDADERTRERFIEEAQVTGQLSHPNIVPVHDLGFTAEGELYFTMKLVKGRSLEETLDELRGHPRTAESSFSLTRLLNVFVKVCEAIDFAHSKGVVHRDLKPDNIMLGDFGEVLVMDWGLVKVGATRKARSSRRQQAEGSAGILPAPHAQDAHDTGSSDAADLKLAEMVESFRSKSGSDVTLDGQVAGTPAYMPAEQAEGRIDEIDERSDVYSLGAILYEMLCLEAPVGGETVVDVLRNAAAGKISPPEQRGSERNIPKDLSAIAMKALSKERDQRYSNVGDLRRDVELYLEDRSVSAREESFLGAMVKLVRRNRGASIAALIASHIIIGIVAYAYNVNLQARKDAESALAAYESEKKVSKAAEQTTRKVKKGSAERFFESARRKLLEKDLDATLKLINQCIDYDHRHIEALQLRACLHVHARRWDEAIADFKHLARLSPREQQLKSMVACCMRAKQEEDTVIWRSFAKYFNTLGYETLAADMEENQARLFALYQLRLDKAFPGASFRRGTAGELTLTLNDRKDVADLSPLKGMPLQRLGVYNTKVADLSPLKGMELRELRFTPRNISTGIDAIRNMKMLGTIGVDADNKWPAAEFWKKYDAGEFSK